jgi:hypothetical protein
MGLVEGERGQAEGDQVRWVALVQKGEGAVAREAAGAWVMGAGWTMAAWALGSAWAGAVLGGVAAAGWMGLPQPPTQSGRQGLLWHTSRRLACHSQACPEEWGRPGRPQGQNTEGACLRLLAQACGNRHAPASTAIRMQPREG